MLREKKTHRGSVDRAADGTPVSRSQAAWVKLVLHTLGGNAKLKGRTVCIYLVGLTLFSPMHKQYCLLTELL